MPVPGLGFEIHPRGGQRCPPLCGSRRDPAVLGRREEPQPRPWHPHPLQTHGLCPRLGCPGPVSDVGHAPWASPHPRGGADPAGHRQETSPSCRKELRFICSKNHGLKKPVGKCTVCVPCGVASSRGTPDPRPACVFTAHLRPQVRSPVRREPRFQPKPPAPPLARPPPLLPRAVQKQTEPNPCSKKKKNQTFTKTGAPHRSPSDPAISTTGFEMTSNTHRFLAVI